jgi:TolB-like protein/DNA-binding winged helix-turn-helix (wHTH) protein/Tfp pilus assembly protein PilF
MEHSATVSGSIWFADYELRRQSDELYSDGSPVKLAPQPYKVLRYLAENAGRLVTRGELRNAVWGAETFVDFDKGLNLCIAQIREALGDNAKSPLYIETLPRRGYRFVAKVEKRDDKKPESNEGVTASLPGPDPSTPVAIKLVPYRFGPLSSLLAVLALMIIGGAAAGFFYFRTGSGAALGSAPERSMLLVLPLDNLTNDPAQEYFSDGLTEELIARLGALQPQSLGVIARTTALKYKRTDKDIRRIGEELGVNYVLEGSVRREAGRVRVTSELIEVKDQTHLWAATYDREDADVLDIEREVATEVATALRLELLPGTRIETIAKKARPEAYDAYLKGRYLIAKDTQEDLERSVPYFDQAIATDPDFAPAYAAEVEALSLEWDSTGRERELKVQKAKAAAHKAIELDPQFSEAYAALASVQLKLEWDIRSAETNLKRAVELNPNNPLTRIDYGKCLLAKGDRNAAAAEFAEALRLDPVGLLTTGLVAFANLQAGNYDEAIVLANRMLELEPKSPAARDCLFRSYISKGEYEQALKYRRGQMSQMASAKTDAKAKLDEQFRNDLAEMRNAAAKGEEVWTMYAAWLSVKLGDKDQTFEWLDKALQDHGSFLVFLDVDPVWQPLRSDPRFDGLRKQIVPQS